MQIATVDHGLRDGSQAEAGAVALAARTLGLAHDVLRWKRPGGGNLMAQARKGRADLLRAWAKQHDIPAIALGHTRDDLAETLIMRLSRGAGIDGLSAMSDAKTDCGIVWLRPLLDLGREELRVWLREIDADWAEDPSNDDPTFQRARVRAAIAQLGLDPRQLAASACNLRAARLALDAALVPVIEGAQTRYGTLHLNPNRVFQAPVEQQRRIVVAAIRWVSDADYPPRRAGVEYVLSAVAQGLRATLDGAVIAPGPTLAFHREPAACNGLQSDIWDKRWRIAGLRDDDRIRALGADCSGFDWRGAGLSHLEAQALPAILRNGAVLVPILSPVSGVDAIPLRGMTEFTRILLAH